jgi:S-adenosyl-L-methionine hydrolase (adenosine-forming)
MFVTFLSDFGLQDDFVGTCHGVIKRIAPEVQIIDITHGIPPRSVVQGALVLANTVPYMPQGVHLAVIDPGVGGARRALALRDREGRMYVGPDNGLLLPAAGRAGIDEAHEILNPEYALEPVSRTFHGRDIFAPAAAHLAKGVELGELGPPIDPAALVQLELPTANLGRNRIEATVLYVDNFGNIQLNLTREHLDQLAIEPGARVELELDGRRYYATAARTFSDARRGDLILYEDSYRNIAVAMNRGDAGEMLSARPGQSLRINLDAP